MVTAHEILSVFTIFCRITGIFFLVPPFSNSSLKPAFKTALALAIAFMFYNINSPKVSYDPSLTILVIISEIVVGIAFGVIINTLCAAVQIAGLTIASQMGLSAAAMFDQSQKMQNSTPGIILSMLTAVMIIESGLSVKIIANVANSYDAIPIGYAFDQYNNLTSLVIKTISKMWEVGVQMSMPFILINISIMIGVGILAKLMPQMQVFFIFLPLQVMIGIFLFAMMLSGLIIWFLEFFSNEISLI